MPNLLILALAALVPMVMGFIWYNPKVLGTVWMNASGMTEEKMKGANMAVIFIVSYILSFLLAFALYHVVVHQAHMFSILIDEPGFKEKTGEVWSMYDAFMEQYGTNFRTFKHGVFHGVLNGFLFATPVLATNALFERKGFKYIAVNCGYWIITIGLMGGVICQFA